MSRFLLVSSVMATLVVAGCSSKEDPFALDTDASLMGPGIDATSNGNGGGGNPDAAPPGTIDAGTDQPGLRCPAIPTRFVVLGDSITNCTVVGGPDAADCVSKQVFDYVKATYAPKVTYVNVAVPGAQTDGLPQQLRNVAPGPGHLLVMIYMGGNDLAPHIFESDDAAQKAYDEMLPGIVKTWLDTHAFFEDTTKFPDGATIIMNNQYNPFDDCTAPPYRLSAAKINLLHMFNVVLGDIANEKFKTTIIIDQHKPFLGHGHHYNVATCPYYKAGLTGFMKDLIHANGPGNAHLAAQIDKGVDRLYKDCP
jgi:hypothetical protein